MPEALELQGFSSIGQTGSGFHLQQYSGSNDSLLSALFTQIEGSFFIVNKFGIAEAEEVTQQHIKKYIMILFDSAGTMEEFV